MSVYQPAVGSGVWGHARRYLAMLSVNNIAKVGNYAIYLGLIYVGVDYRLSWAIGAIIMFVVTFGGNREVWRRGFGS